MGSSTVSEVLCYGPQSYITVGEKFEVFECLERGLHARRKDFHNIPQKFHTRLYCLLREYADRNKLDIISSNILEDLANAFLEVIFPRSSEERSGELGETTMLNPQISTSKDNIILPEKQRSVTGIRLHATTRMPTWKPEASDPNTDQCFI